MSKYNEVMDNIKVSEEMRKRILGNIEKELGEGALVQEADQAKDISQVSKGTEKTGSRIPINKEKIIRFITFYGSRAAVFLLIAAGTYGVIRTVGLKDNHQMSAPSSTMYEAESAHDAAAESAEDYAEEPSTYEEESEAPATYERESETPDLTLIDSEEAAEAVVEEPVTDGAADALGTEPVTDKDLNADNQSGLQSAQESNLAAENAAGSANKAAKAQGDDSAIGLNSDTTGLTGNSAASASEMSEKLGYDIKGLSFLDDNSSRVEYSYYSEGGEITYHSDYGTIHLYASDKGVFTGNSGSAPGSPEATKQIDAGGKTIDAYGKEDNYTTLIWSEDGITYVIVSKKGLSEDLINKMF